MITQRTTLLAIVFSCLYSLTLSSPAQAKKIRIDMASAYPSRLAHLGFLAKGVAKKITDATDGEVRVRFHEPGALVPPLQLFDAVAKGSIDAAWSAAGFWTGKDPAFALFSAVPFGPGASEYLAWFYYGGGKELADELYRSYGIIYMPCGMNAPEASGWFRKEVKSVADLKGLKMRFFGLGAKVMERLGVATQSIAGGEIYQALQLGTIDATEFGMPEMDLSFGFYQVAKHYYFPGWHQPATFQDLMISTRKWQTLSPAQQTVIQLACGDNVREGLARAEAVQFAALQKIQSKGVTLQRWSNETLDRFRTEWEIVANEQTKKSPHFAKTWKSLTEFRANYKIWRDLGFTE